MAPAVRDREQSDAQLMVRARAADADAFATLYDRYAGRAFRIARAVCRDSGRAEEVVQEAFLAIWRNRDAYRPEAGNFQSWSMRIVKNRAIDSSRALAARPKTHSDDGLDHQPLADSGSDSPHEAAQARSERDQLLASLRKLPEAQAEVIVLAFYGELSHSEIAHELSIPSGTVKGRMRLGLEKLRRELDLAAEPGLSSSISDRSRP